MFKHKRATFVSSSLFNVRICCFSLPRLTESDESLGLFVWQRNRDTVFVRKDELESRQRQSDQITQRLFLDEESEWREFITGTNRTEASRCGLGGWGGGRGVLSLSYVVSIVRKKKKNLYTHTFLNLSWRSSRKITNHVTRKLSRVTTVRTVRIKVAPKLVNVNMQCLFF